MLHDILIILSPTILVGLFLLLRAIFKQSDEPDLSEAASADHGWQRRAASHAAEPACRPGDTLQAPVRPALVARRDDDAPHPPSVRAEPPLTRPAVVPQDVFHIDFDRDGNAHEVPAGR